MAKIIFFRDALIETNKKARVLLLGNGFSIAHFSYHNLLEKTGLADNDPLKIMFNALNTFDFETVIRALEDAVLVERTYGNIANVKLFQDDADRLRSALVHAVRATHPSHRENIEDRIPSCISFLKNFVTIFTLNYDLLLYWVQLADTKSFQDGFGLGDSNGRFLGPFKVGAFCNTYNLHGGLHLFMTDEDDVEKQLMGASGVIDAIAQTITRGRRLPIYVAEGTSRAKLTKIRTIPYLQHAFEQLEKSEGVVFVYGHSADPNDAHIYQAIFNSKVERLYFFIHRPTADVNKIDGELARYKAQAGSKIEYTFVDSESAEVWGK